MEYFDEESFKYKMDTVVAPFLRINLKEGSFRGYDGNAISYAYLKNPMEKAAIVICHGYCEFIHKYHELMYYMYQMGYSVFFMTHRGHGYSYREVTDDLDMVHINDFNEYVEDFHIYINELVLPNSSSKKLFLYGHSMGGGIGARYLELHPGVFERAVLSSPMMEMSYGKLPRPVVKAVLVLASIFGWKYKYMAGQSGFDGKNKYETSSCQSKARYNYFFDERLKDEHYRTYGGSYGWLRAGVKVATSIKKDAGKIDIPVLLFQAGKDRLVQPEAQIVFAEKSKNTKLVVFEKSKHEIFNAYDEDRYRYFDMVFEFFNN